ncbi:MAG: DUF1592 domain-containing protein [Akkermansiaceae bacterium]
MIFRLVFVSSIALGTLQAKPLVADFVETYCIDCHGDGTTKGGLDLGKIVDADPAKNWKTWEHAILRMNSRQMPPPNKDRPSSREYDEMLSGLTEYLDGISKSKPQLGRVPAMRRLTRTEYQNAIRDLLGVSVEVEEMLPKDESSHGFDNITVGELSPTLLNRYLGAAKKIARIAVGSSYDSPDLRVVRIPADRSQKEHVEGLPLGTRGGVLFEHTFAVAGEYEFEIRLARDRNEEVEGLIGGRHEIELLVDGERVKSFTVERPKNRNHNDVDAHLKVRIMVPEGNHKVGVTFPKKSTSILETKRQPYHAEFNFHRHPRQAPAIFQVSLTGPFNAKNARSRFEEKDLSGLMQLAYRREITAKDWKAIEPFAEQGLEMAVAAILVSPRFLFRVENDPESIKRGEVYLLPNHQLATRLSFFLWSSLPDLELLNADLSKSDVFEKQVRRMLADPRAESLATNFANQWLQLRNLDGVMPDLRLFPDFDDNLRQSFKRETELLFQTVLQDNRKVSDLIGADFTFLNERLATHYGIPHIYGSRFRRVDLDSSIKRGGLLRQGSILTVTSYANRTSPVIRGNWVLENILGTPAPPPPPETPTLDDVVVADDLPFREKLAAHSQDKSCASCHKLMDPPGFALEEYDAVGRFITGDVDAAGGLPDGRTFTGVDPLEEALLERPDLFARTISEKMLTYALGRGVEYFDAPALREIVNKAAPEYRLSELILGITQSVPFTHRQKP